MIPYMQALIGAAVVFAIAAVGFAIHPGLGVLVFALGYGALQGLLE